MVGSVVDGIICVDRSFNLAIDCLFIMLSRTIAPYTT